MMSTSGNVPKSKTIRKKTADNTVLSDENTESTRRHEAMLARRGKLHSVSDRLAGSTFFYRNWYIPEGKEVFPQHNDMRSVDKMYPYAELEEGKTEHLLIDEPRFPHEIEACEIKKKVLLGLGYKYVVIKPGMTLQDAMMGLTDGLDNETR